MDYADRMACTATVLAALRFYQEKGQGDPANRSDDIHDLATAGDTVISLDEFGIDELCEDLNLGVIALVDGKLPTAAAELADLMEDALTTHIYDEQNGDEIPEDCAYTSAIEAVRAAVADHDEEDDDAEA